MSHATADSPASARRGSDEGPETLEAVREELVDLVLKGIAVFALPIVGLAAFRARFTHQWAQVGLVALLCSALVASSLLRDRLSLSARALTLVAATYVAALGGLWNYGLASAALFLLLLAAILATHFIGTRYGYAVAVAGGLAIAVTAARAGPAGAGFGVDFDALLAGRPFWMMMLVQHLLLTGLAVFITGRIVGQLAATVGALGTRGRALQEVNDRLVDAAQARESAQRELRARQAELRFAHNAMDQAPIGIAWLRAADGELLYANAVAARGVGRAVEDLAASTIGDFVVGLTDDEWGQWLASIAKQGAVRVETTLRRADGAEFPAEITGYVTDFDGEDVMVVFVVDTTARRRAEQDLRNAKEEAENANRARSTFLAQMSHEIKTPLHAVVGFAQLLQRHPGMGDEQLAHLSSIHGAGDQLLEIVNDIIEMAKLESGSVDVVNGPVEIRGLVSDVVSRFSDRADAKGLSLDSSCEENVPGVVAADSQMLERILAALVSNAVKFTPSGSVSVRVRARSSEPPCIEVDVQDSGPGVPEDDLELMFEAFRQSDESSARTGGTGLGLPICRGYARMMGGDVSYGRPAEGGSLFRLSFPATPLGLPTAPEVELDSAATQDELITRARLTLDGLPEDVHAALAQAVRSADLFAFVDRVEAALGHDDDVAQWLRRRADLFDLELLGDLLRQGEDDT